jgi:hypothetical protein
MISNRKFLNAFRNSTLARHLITKIRYKKICDVMSDYGGRGVVIS